MINEELEGTQGTTTYDIDGIDQNLTVDEMFQQNKIDSLAKYVCSVSPLDGPGGAIFNLKVNPNNNGVKLVRKEVVTFPSEPIRTDISNESIYDMRAMFGKNADKVIGKLLRGLSNVQENERLFQVLNAEAKLDTDLQLSDSLNSSTNFAEIGQKVQELIIKMNQKDFRTYESFVILPVYALGAFANVSTWVNSTNADSDNLFITKINKTSYYLNPNVESTMAYVGLKDNNMSKSSLYFVPYVSEIQDAIDPDSGINVFRIYNRFAISTSVLHEAGNEMLYKFNILK